MTNGYERIWKEIWRIPHLSKTPLPRRLKHALSCLKPQTLFTSSITFLARGRLSNNSSNNKHDNDDRDTDSRRDIFRIRRIHNGTLTGLVTSCVKLPGKHITEEKVEETGQRERSSPFWAHTTSKKSEDLVYTATKA
jgi:hypothetical protein